MAFAHPRPADLSRSRSPQDDAHDVSSKRQRTRSRSPDHHRRRRHHHAHHHSKKANVSTPVVLPFSARSLSKHDLEVFRGLFALYLDIQKGLVLDELEGGEEEIRGRWKSFLKKWNRGELAEGWYDPSTLKKAKERSTEDPPNTVEVDNARQSRRRNSPDYREGGADREEEEEVDDEDDDYGPSLPGLGKGKGRRAGPGIPNVQDLQVKREMEDDSALEAKQQYVSSIRTARKADRALQKSRLDDLAPRAEPGSRERQLEKKRELAASNKTFAAETKERSPELNEEEVMGGGDDLGTVKRVIKEQERKKNERELRKEEVLRAGAAEREERMAVHREKEQKTVEMLKDLARARFGGPGGG